MRVAALTPQKTSKIIYQKQRKKLIIREKGEKGNELDKKYVPNVKVGKIQDNKEIVWTLSIIINQGCKMYLISGLKYS